MGLDCSHDAFHGAYSAFNSFRSAVCRAVGGTYPPHWLRTYDGDIAKDESGRPLRDLSLEDGMWYVPDDFTRDKHPGLYEFLEHSDCDGSISPAMCSVIADELEPLLDKMPQESHGHIERDGGYRAVLKRFIDGCLAAHLEGKPLRFG